MIPRKSCRACLLLVTFSCSIPGWAQRTPPGRVFTLAEASRQALEGHPSLVAAGQRIRVAEGTRIGSAKRPNPKLLVSGENFPLGSTEGGFEFGRSLEWNVVFSQPFELAGKRAKRARIADYGVRSSTSDLETRRRAILAEVRRAYEAGLYAEAIHSLLKENRQNYSELVRFAEVRVSEGFTAEGDLIKLRLESRVADYEIELARVFMRHQRSGFCAPLGRELSRPVLSWSRFSSFGRSTCLRLNSGIGSFCGPMLKRRESWSNKPGHNWIWSVSGHGLTSFPASGTSETGPTTHGPRR